MAKNKKPIEDIIRDWTIKVNGLSNGVMTYASNQNNESKTAPTFWGRHKVVIITYSVFAVLFLICYIMKWDILVRTVAIFCFLFSLGQVKNAYLFVTDWWRRKG